MDIDCLLVRLTLVVVRLSCHLVWRLWAPICSLGRSLLCQVGLGSLPRAGRLITQRGNWEFPFLHSIPEAATRLLLCQNQKLWVLVSHPLLNMLLPAYRSGTRCPVLCQGERREVENQEEFDVWNNVLNNRWVEEDGKKILRFVVSSETKGGTVAVTMSRPGD